MSIPIDSSTSVPVPAAVPLSLYIHFPWCVRKCPYCDFNSHPLRDPEVPEKAYVDALVADLEADLPRVWGRRIGSVFLGGGTPSLFSAASIERLLAAVRARLPVTGELEVTMEANPGTAEAGRFRSYRTAGVNRLSIGIQSFSDTCLAALGRIHDGRQALRAVDAARKAGFDNLNLDLMFGLPGQTVEAARADLQRALSLAPEHISYYQLTLEPSTELARRPPELPAEEDCECMQEAAIAAMAEAGLARYEVSAYGRPGRRCRHNLNYWQFGDYLGIGAGAHAKLTSADAIVRLWKTRHPRAYLEAGQDKGRIAGQRELGRADRVLELMMNALRLVEGIPVELFTARTGLGLEVIGEHLLRARARGLMVSDPGRLAATGQGLRYLNELLQDFVP
jgi:putative oxygen-independent coproporphyrinogen III oxidase